MNYQPTNLLDALDKNTSQLYLLRRTLASFISEKTATVTTVYSKRKT